MVGGILHTDQVSVGPPIQIGVLATDVSVARVAGLALTAVHGVGKMSQVVTTGVFVAVVTSIETGITRRAHLERQEEDKGEEARSESLLAINATVRTQHQTFHLSLPGSTQVFAPLWVKCTCLFFGGGLLHTLAVRLWPRVARRTGQAVVAGLGVLAAVNAVELKAGVRDFLALLRGKLAFWR